MAVKRPKRGLIDFVSTFCKWFLKNVEFFIEIYDQSSVLFYFDTVGRQKCLKVIDFGQFQNVFRTYTIIICDKNAGFRAGVRGAFKDNDVTCAILEFSTNDACLNYLVSRSPELIVLEHLADQKEPFKHLRKVKEACPECSVILVSECEDAKTIVEAVKAGADQYVIKNQNPNELMERAKEIMKHDELKHKARGMQDALETYKEPLFIPTQHGHYQELLTKAVKSAKAGLTLLIEGETGTGKSAVAQYIHRYVRSDYPLITMNCGAVPKDFLESTLFGHEQGAFTGADHQRQGKMELAHNGILFLDEIGNMPLETQAKILTAIEEKKFERLGSSKPMLSDFLLISATNRNLAHMVEDGLFRPDLFHRINQARIELPALRNAPEVISEYVHHFLAYFNQKYGKNITLPPDLMAQLTKYPWKGNVRELKNELQSIVALEEPDKCKFLFTGRALTVEQPEKIASPRPTGVSTLDGRVIAFEKQQIETALHTFNYNISKTADYLGVGRAKLYRRMIKYVIDYKSPVGKALDQLKNLKNIMPLVLAVLGFPF